MRVNHRRRVVTVVLPGSDSDDCFCRSFEGRTAYYDALEFAAECAIRIDKSAFEDCLCNTDGNVRMALQEFNEHERFTNGNGVLGNSVITISSEFTGAKILAACEGRVDWCLAED